jgi:hypothetical protein
MKLKISAIIAFTFLALAGAAAFIIWRSSVEGYLGPDVFKLSYEFLLITIVGGAVSAIYKQFQQDRDERAAERALQIDLLNESVRTYNAAKKARRLLRAKAIEPVVHLVHRDAYDNQMQDLMDAQLGFESFVERVKANPVLFPGLEVDFVEIQSYLNKILDQYINCLFKFSGSPPTLPLTSLSELKDFVAPYKKGSAFDTNFKRPFDRITKALQSLITK